MKLSEAEALMVGAGGYRVSFEKREDGMLTSDYFPARDEAPIRSIHEALALAQRFAGVDPSIYVNVYVIHAHDWTPVNGYDQRILNRHPPKGNT